MVTPDANGATDVDRQEPAAAERYLLLADISGYTGFLAGVEVTHSLDFSGGIPAGYPILAALLGTVIDGIQPSFAVVKLEGDAVFAAAPAGGLDRRGDEVLRQLRSTYRAFIAARTEARSSTDDTCTACVAVEGLDLKVILHRGQTVRQRVGTSTDLLGPAVNVAHRLLKNTVRARIGYRPYVLVTDAAAAPLGLAAAGAQHHEEYADVGRVSARLIDLASDTGDPMPDDAGRAVRPT